MSSVHQPVLLKEVLEHLAPAPGQNFIDGTFGGGGHSAEILKRIAPDGKLLAIDADKNTEKYKEIKGNKNIIFVNDNFCNLQKIVQKNFPYPVHGILLDLGLSSDQLENSGRGFSFQKDEPLDMRFDVNQDLTAAHILNSYSLENIYDIFKNFGEFAYARLLSQSVFKQRKIKKFATTFDLVNLIAHIHPRRHWEKIHPATLPFQALRIAVNDELESLKQVLPQAVEILAPGGRLAIISFHALEDRIVKNYFRELSRLCPSNHNDPATQLDYGGQAPIIKILTKKPIVPSEEEMRENPRSRSAKLRAIEKI
jgi:16S rRNA (cytosine1402-N4)-methyltransferase